MPDIRNGACDKEVSDNFWFCRCVEHGDPDETEEAIDVAKLECQNARSGG